MSVTPLEVLDSAIKIGLGAALTALGALLTGAVSGAREWNREKRRHRLQVAEKSAEGLEPIHDAVLRLVVEYGGCLGDAAEREITPKALHDSAMAAQAISHEEVFPALLSLRTLAARLAVVGGTVPADAISIYSVAVTKLTGLMLDHPAAIGNPQAAHKQWMEAAKAVELCHGRILDCIKKYIDEV